MFDFNIIVSEFNRGWQWRSYIFAVVITLEPLTDENYLPNYDTNEVFSNE